MAKIIRRNKIYGDGGKIPVGRTLFDQNYVYHEGGPEFIPETNVPRLRLAHLGQRALGAFEDEIDAVVEGLRAERDARKASKPAPSKQRARTQVMRRME
jgi:hypothetical protein